MLTRVHPPASCRARSARIMRGEISEGDLAAHVLGHSRARPRATKPRATTTTQ